MISGFETCNKYEVKNAMGHWVYFAAEENDDFNLNCYGPLRSFTIKLFDSTNQPVMQLSRDFHCSSCCCPCICCLQEVNSFFPSCAQHLILSLKSGSLSSREQPLWIPSSATSNNLARQLCLSLRVLEYFKGLILQLCFNWEAFEQLDGPNIYKSICKRLNFQKLIIREDD